MIGHLSLGVSDIPRSTRFYDATMGALGFARVWTHPEGRGIGYGLPGGNDKLALFLQSTDARLAAGPGTHIAFDAPSAEAVYAFHAAAVANGGIDVGPPGPRPQYSPTYVAAFVLDPDGHKLEAVHQ